MSDIEGESFGLENGQDLEEAEEVNNRKTPLLNQALTGSNVSLASILGAPDEAKRRQEESRKLLTEEHVNEPDSSHLVSSSLVSMASWVKTAATSILGHERGEKVGHSPPPRQLSENILQRVSGNEETSSRIRDKKEKEKEKEKIHYVDATDTICSYPNCVQGLNIAVSRFHCRKCNGWYCALHAGHPSMGLKLNPTTGEGSHTGLWSRVCQRCFNESAALNTIPSPIDHTAIFVASREKHRKKAKDQERLLMGRLQKLGNYSADKKIPWRVYERHVVFWEPDHNMASCPVCKIVFTAIIRKHHCRLCGRIICGESNCSLFIPLTTVQGKRIELRVCPKCYHIVIEMPQQRHELGERDAFSKDFLRVYSEVKQVKDQIAGILPRFNDQLFRFEDEMDKEEPAEHKVLEARHEAAAARDTLILLFRHLKNLAFSLKELPLKHEISSGLIRSQVCQNVARSIYFYLQENQLTLQFLPRLDMKRLRKPKEPTIVVKTHQRAPSSLAPSASSFFGDLFHTHTDPDIELPAPANLISLKEKCKVLEEQRDQLEGFLTEAVKGQRFDDVRSLRTSLQDIKFELYRVNKTLSNYSLNDIN